MASLTVSGEHATPGRRSGATRGAARLSVIRERGFTLVALMIALIVLNVAVATAMQLWSKVAQREKEEELIFRGLQYAEAIRVFQRRFDRPPTTLEELMEVRPRVIRQLWTDPLSESGEWIPILAGSGSEATALAQGTGPGESRGARPGQGRQGSRRTNSGFGSGRQRPGQQRPGQQRSGQSSGGRSGLGERSESGSFGSRSSGQAGTGEQLSRAFDEAAGLPGQGGSSFGSNAEETQIGPIEGVKPTAKGDAMKHFLGQADYGSWEFRAAMLAEPRVSPEGVPLSPRLDPSALGRPFPDWLTGVLGAGPHPNVEGQTPSERASEESDDF